MSIPPTLSPAIAALPREEREALARRLLADQQRATGAALDRDRYARYAGDPVGFVRKELRLFPWSRQREILESVRDHPRTSVRSCHSSGKTKIAAGIVLWFLYSHPDSIVVTTAPGGRQVKKLLWTEIGALFERAHLPGRCMTEQLTVDKRWFAIGFSSNTGGKFHGFHAKHLLLVMDEASEIEEPIFQAVTGILTNKNARQLLIGNPLSNAGTFYNSHHSLRAMWNTFHISAFDTPNFTGEAVPAIVRESLVDQQWVTDRRQEWSEENPLYQAKVLGNFPTQGEWSIYSLLWIEAAKEREGETGGPRQPIEVGADIARQGSCENVVYGRWGDRILGMDAWRSDDLIATAGRIARFARGLGATVLKIDATGMGSGVVDELRQIQRRDRDRWQIVEVYVGASPSDEGKRDFQYLGDELQWSLRQRLQEGRLGGLTDSVTQGQLVPRQYRTHLGKIRVESKEELMKRGLPSPDRADALVLAFAEGAAVMGRSRRVHTW